MDLNLVVLCGRLAAPTEVKVMDGGSRMIRALVTVRSETPARRVDVVPVILWDPDENTWETVGAANPGDRVWVAGAVQRRFWAAEDGRRSRLEVVAEQICLRETTE